MQFESPDALKECRILIVEDSKANVDILVRALRKDYTLGVALDGRKALDFAGSAHTRPNLILLDIVMPEMDGFAVCRALKDNPETRDIPIIFITAMDDPGHKAEGFEHGAVDYITKPFEIAEVQARVKTHLALQLAQEELRNQNIILENRVRKRTRELEETRREVIDRLSMAAEYHDLDTGHHIRRISDFCHLLGLAVGLSEDQAEVLALAGSMHDVGKIGISDSILLKPGKLNAEEWAIMKTHTTIGAKLLAGGRSEILQQAKIIAETHHEKWDGTGYPRGLKGRDIPLFGRIACVCDVFDALISKRPYKEPWPIEKAFAEIENGSGSHFDPDLVQLFLNLENEFRSIAEKRRCPTTDSDYFFENRQKGLKTAPPMGYIHLQHSTSAGCFPKSGPSKGGDMALLFGSPKKSPVKKNTGRDKRLEMAREGYLNGKIKLVTTDEIPGREVQGVFGLIVCRGYNFDKAFYGLLAQAQDVNADAVVGYRESVSFHPEGDKYFSCYGTACRLKQKK